jgi:hypothetical protein
MKDKLTKVSALLPNLGASLPAELTKRGEELLHELKMCKNETRLLVKLKVISKALKFFAEKTRIENSNKVRMMAICERDRSIRLGRISNGRDVDTV